MIVRRRIAFSETDASGRVHFSTFLKWAEDVEHQILLEAGYPLCAEGSGWPRVHVECDYQSPVSFGQDVDIEVSVKEIGQSSISWEFQIRSPLGNKQVATGKMVTVLVIEGAKTRISDSLREQLLV